ncbi:MAG: NACHT domain-containing protein [Thermodesulfobacteriota bacterium]
MFSKIYDIERFWCPTDGTIGLDEWGFLQDPHTYDEWMGQPDSVPFEYIEDVPVLIMLGEPGTGKSEWFESARTKLGESIQLRGHRALWINLGLYERATEVVDAVFRDAEFVQWTQGDYRLHLFLDSFDECHFRVEVLPKRLVAELEKQPLERLCLRILCRTSEWPLSFEGGLKRLWGDRLGVAFASGQRGTLDQAAILEPGDQPVQIFELALLRRDDVVQIVRGEGIEPEPFLEEIQKRELVPFAFRPQSLAFLVKYYRASGRFPSDQVELYREGCRELCKETDPDRTDARLTGKFQTDDLFVVAQRLAALTVFCNRHSISRYDSTADELRSGEIALRDVCHGFETVAGRQVDVREDIIRETLNTGLYSGRPEGRMGWAHQSYAEILAAEYLCGNNLPVDQIMALIRNPHVPGGKIPPQLSETAAWLALMNQDIRDRLMAVDPEILLTKMRHADAVALPEGFREQLVGTLLKLLDEGELLDHRISRSLSLRNLWHPKLAEQLLPYITDRTKSFPVRRVAIGIAEENEVRQLQEAICGVTLDAADDYLVRIPAAHALVRIADDDAKLRMKPLALEEREDDPDDELKGCALKALWPHLLQAEELFGNITAPKNIDLFGTYKIFLWRDLGEGMNTSHLPCALRWAQQQPRDYGQPFSFKDLIDSIMDLAFNYLGDPIILEEFAKAALHRLQEYEEIIPCGTKDRHEGILFSDDNRRRCLFEAMIRVAAESGASSRSNAADLSSVLLQDDVSWLLDLFQRTTSRAQQEIISFLIARFFDPSDSAIFERIDALSRKYPMLAEVLRPHVEPIVLGSKEASAIRERFEREQARLSARAPEPTSPKWSEGDVLRCLAEIEQGHHSKFALLSWRIVDSQRGSSPFDSLPLDLTKLNFWRACSDDTRERLGLAAMAYIMNCDPEAKEWIETKKIYWTAWAGCIALTLILRVNLNSLKGISPTIWNKWAPAILACSSGRQDIDSQALIAEMYACAPDTLISHVGRQISFENSTSGQVFIVDVLKKCWDQAISQAILRELTERTLTVASVDSLLTALTSHDPETAVSFAKSSLKIPLPARGRKRIAALVSAKVLMVELPEVGWSMIWPAIASARLFGHQLMSLLTHGAHSELDHTFLQFPPDTLATLYVWLAREYPMPVEEKKRRLLRSPTMRDMGECVLRHLQDRGTLESIRALQDLCVKLPEQAGRLRWVLESAKDRTLAMSWTPWQPEDILGVVQDHQKRLVRSGDQLLQVVIESLARFRQTLHGELPAIRELWDHQVRRLSGRNRETDSWIPVAERSLADRIARHLRDDLKTRGIVIGREVQIRPGQLTDIHVDAITKTTCPDRIDLIKVIIEVKGCWNDGVERDMEGQLLNRYMAENKCSHGLYLVGWFYCDSWDQEDYRSRKPRKEFADMPIERAEETFNGQASNLSCKSGKHVRAFVLDARLR